MSFGSERVEEAATLESFYAPGGGIEFFTNGHSPVSLEILSKGHYVHLGGAGGFGPELVAEVPLVSTVPGAPYASVESISVKAGSAHKVHGKPVYYGRVPEEVPEGRLPDQDRTDLRRRRGRAARARGGEGDLQVALPEGALSAQPAARGGPARWAAARGGPALATRGGRARRRWRGEASRGRVCPGGYANIRSYEPETVSAGRRARGGACSEGTWSWRWRWPGKWPKTVTGRWSSAVALRFLPLVAAQRPDDYDGWASRWLVRWLTEAPEASIDGAVDVAAALAALPLEPQAIETISQLGG